jgi:hypothetical protein
MLSAFFDLYARFEVIVKNLEKRGSYCGRDPMEKRGKRQIGAAAPI